MLMLCCTCGIVFMDNSYRYMLASVRGGPGTIPSEIYLLSDYFPYFEKKINVGLWCLHAVCVSPLPTSERLNQSESKSRYDWRSVSQVLMSSPFWFSWPDVCYCLTVTVVSLWGAPSDERSGLSIVSQSLHSEVICQYIYKYAHFRCLMYKFVYIHYI
jgi:hypothetical protein